MNYREPHERLAYEIEDFAETILAKDNDAYNAWKEQTITVMTVLAAAKAKVH